MIDVLSSITKRKPQDAKEQVRIFKSHFILGGWKTKDDKLDPFN